MGSQKDGGGIHKRRKGKVKLELVDRYKRPINYLRISVTDRCNLKCQYCRPLGDEEFLPHKELLSFEEIIRVIKVMAKLGLRKVRLTGGEPLLRRNLTELIAQIARIPGIEDLSLTTNGTLLASYARELKEAGLKRVNVSLDTLKRERFAEITQKDAFQEVWKGIESALREGLEPVKINVVSMRGFNDDEIEDLASLTFKLPVHVRFIEFMPIGENLWEDQRVIGSEEILQRLSKIAPLMPLPRGPYDGPARRFKFEGAWGEVGIISPLSAHFCSRCNRLRLTPDGKLRSCLFSDEEVDLKAYLRKEGEEGILKALKEALEKKPYLGVRDGFRLRKCQRPMDKIGG